MSRQDTSAGLDRTAWLIGDVRLTAFTDPLAPREALAEAKPWEAVVGTPPETAVSRMFGTEREENGPFAAGGRLTYKRTPRGVEWFLQALPDPDKPETLFGLAPTALTPFKELMRRWLMECPPLRRLAFGAALYLPVEDKKEGYRQLGTYLGLHLDPDHSGDFLYQINRRRPSGCGVPGLEINRLSKWTWLQVGLRPGDGEQIWTGIRGSACLLELDVNTAPEFPGLLPRESLGPLFEELVALGEEIAAQGDVP